MRGKIMSLLNTELPHAKIKEYDWYQFLYYERYFKNTEGKILDVGCGVGNFIIINPERIEGVDIDEKAIQKCKERGLKARKGSGYGLPYASNTFDNINCSAVLEHVGSPHQLMKELRRVLKPNGKLVLLTPDITKWGFDFWSVAYHWEGHPFSKKSLLALAHDHGFRDIKVENGFVGVPFPFGTLLQDAIGKFKRTRNLVMEAKK